MKKRMLLDGTMLIVFLFLFDYRFVHNRGHEILAILLLVLILVHNRWNFSWYKSLRRGRWTKQRIFSFLIDAVLILSFITVMVTGLSISMTVFPYHPFMPFWVNGLHVAAGYLMFIFIGLHLGLHWNAILPRLQKAASLKKSKILTWVNRLLLLVILASGVYFSFDCHVGNHLLMIASGSSYSKFTGLGWFLWGHLMIIGLYAAVAYYGQKLLARR